MVARNRSRSGKNACPVTAYARAVVSGKIVAGRLVGLASERHLADLKLGGKRDLVWDVDAARHAIDFFGQAEAPFAGHLHGSFFPSSNRKHLNARIQLNALLLTEATSLAAEAIDNLVNSPSGKTAEWLTSKEADERARLVSIVAKAISSERKSTKSKWLQYFSELPTFMEKDGRHLAGLPVLLGDDGELHAAMATEPVMLPATRQPDVAAHHRQRYFRRPIRVGSMVRMTLMLSRPRNFLGVSRWDTILR